jgi:hypothetical protein
MWLRVTGADHTIAARDAQAAQSAAADGARPPARIAAARRALALEMRAAVAMPV